jgi:hypothetical protein
MRLKYGICILFFLSLSLAKAQGAVEYLCRIIDMDDKYPVAFATIQFENKGNGVIADEEGSFRLSATYNKDNTSIIISSIGYESLKIKVNSLDLKRINIIYLKPKIEALNEVIIKANTSLKLSVNTILNNAIGRLLTNYPDSPHSYVSYYRDYQLIENSYYNLNESILEDFDAGFKTNKIRFKDNKTALYSYGLNKDFYQDSLLLNSIYGKSKILDPEGNALLGTDIQNELEILNIHNPIRNYRVNSFSFVNVFRDDFVSNHNFKLVKIQYLEDTPLYEIEFKSKTNPEQKYNATGRIYISKGDYAIYKLEYKMFLNSEYKSLRNRGDYFKNVSKNAIDQNNSTLFEITIEYKLVGHKMYLNYMTFNNRFIINELNPFKVEDLVFDVTDKSFYITFNKPVDESTIERKSNFKLRYKNKKLSIKSIKLTKPKEIKIEIVDRDPDTSKDLEKAISADFSYKLKKIKDKLGGSINKTTQLIGYQFREIFTQEIFENKQPEANLIYVNKALSMSRTSLNSAGFNLEKYTINSPLKKTKEN